MVFEPTTSCLESEVLAECHRDIDNRENILIGPNSCLSDLSDSVEFYRTLGVFF